MTLELVPATETPEESTAEVLAVRQEMEEHRRQWPILTCTACKITYGGFQGDGGKPCPHCAQRDNQNRVAGYRGNLMPLSVEDAEVFTQGLY